MIYFLLNGLQKNKLYNKINYYNNQKEVTYFKRY